MLLYLTRGQVTQGDFALINQTCERAGNVILTALRTSVG